MFIPPPPPVFKTLCITALLSLGCFSAQAGQLFPPKNVAGAGKDCPANTSLVWSTSGDEGHVDCISTSSMVTVPTCAAGHSVVGVKDGVATCVSTSSMVSIPTCPSGQAITGIINGAPICGDPPPAVAPSTPRRFVFTSSGSWKVPDGVRNAFVTIAGGGGSGLGWKISNAFMTGHSGGYLFSTSVGVTPGETLDIIVGKGGKGYGPVKTSTLADRGDPYYVYVPPSGDDGTGGYPGQSSKVISGGRVLLECAGGGGAYASGLDTLDTGSLVVGPQAGATIGGGTPKYPSAKRPAAGPFGGLGPGACGPAGYGIGNAGMQQWATAASLPSGSYPGGATPFGYGSGGSVDISGRHVTKTTVGTGISPNSGRDGVVIIDVTY